MRSKLYQYLKAFFFYPFTLAVLSLITLSHVAFYYWFDPSFVIHLSAFIVDIISLLLWIYICIKSERFQLFINQMVSKRSLENLKYILSQCDENFKFPALECIQLSYEIGKNFSDHMNTQELINFLDNMSHIARDHMNLLNRSTRFGTENQKQRMISILNHQVDSMKSTLDTMRSFSGNLTLLSASLENHAMVARELRAINQGLHEVIQEFEDDENEM